MTLNQVQHHKNLIIRSKVLQAIRDYFTGIRYLEVETPIRCPSIIPEAQIDPLTSEGHYLQASPELCMKRLMSKGFDKIFQICKCFRKEERGSHHLPELTMLEWYTKNNTYLDLMAQCKGLIKFIAEQLCLENTIQYQGKNIHLDSPLQRLTVKDAFDRYSDKSLKDSLTDNSFDEILSFRIEPVLGNTAPTILYDYPAQLASLAKLLPENPDYAQRFELYIAGIEIANGFTELTDANEQRIRFKKENTVRIKRGKPRLPLPDAFLHDLKAMPDAAGIALGVDRLVMIFCNATSIDEVISFSPEQL